VARRVGDDGFRVSVPPHCGFPLRVPGRREAHKGHDDGTQEEDNGADFGESVPCSGLRHTINCEVTQTAS